MDEAAFLEALKETIIRCQLDRYSIPAGPALATVQDHWDIGFDLDAIRKDMDSAGGIKLSHGQQRMLEILVTLWNPREADALFERRLSDLIPSIMAMDKENRDRLCSLIYHFPGWGD